MSHHITQKSKQQTSNLVVSLKTKGWDTSRNAPEIHYSFDLPTTNPISTNQYPGHPGGFRGKRPQPDGFPQEEWDWET